MFYIGIYHDQNGDLRLDLKSLDSKPHITVNKLYNDMTNLCIVDGYNSSNFVNSQLDELNESECDLITLTDSDVKQLYASLREIK